MVRAEYITRIDTRRCRTELKTRKKNIVKKHNYKSYHFFDSIDLFIDTIDKLINSMYIMEKSIEFMKWTITSINKSVELRNLNVSTFSEQN